MAQSGEPIGERERIGEVDVLRGLALFGVLTMNFVGFAGEGMMATADQLAALPTAEIDGWAYEFVRVFVGDKANTVFATLFGLGFYIQLSRNQGRPGFERRFARRLGWLFMFGVLNVLFLWTWDILHLYAIAGFGLLFIRHWSVRSLLALGIPLSLYSEHLQAVLIKTLHLPNPLSERFMGDAAVIERQKLFAAGDYPAITAYIAEWNWVEWVSGGLMAAFIVYAFGRFAIGAAIGKSGLFENLDRHVGRLRRIAWIAIPTGLALSVAIRLVIHGAEGLGGDPDLWREGAKSIRPLAALILAGGYAAGVLAAMRRGWGQRLFGPFSVVGRMALTNYLMQGFIYALILFGVGPGLALSGRIGSAAVLAICVAFFALQLAFSHWWLARFRFGPMEWLWRSLTYGTRPAMRRETALNPA